MKLPSLKDFFCYKPPSEKSRNPFYIEWSIYLIIELALIAFLIVSCYNADRLIRFHDEDTNIRNGLNIAMEIVIIFIGIYLLVIWKTGSISKLQICFCCHIGIFLLMTGIATMAATSKTIEKSLESTVPVTVMPGFSR
jgi:uncharacterized membrane protein YidH (DUF202 family)